MAHQPYAHRPAFTHTVAGLRQSRPAALARAGHAGCMRCLNPTALDVGPARQPGVGDLLVRHAQARNQVVAAAGLEDVVLAVGDVGQAGQLVQLLRRAHAESAARQAAGMGGERLFG